MSESTPNPSTSDTSAGGNPEATTAATHAEPGTHQPQAGETPAKRKRKRKRRRKSSNTSENAATSSAPSEVTHSTVAATRSEAQGAKTHEQSHGSRQEASKHGSSGHPKKKPPFEARRASFRDAGERSGRHEFLSTWRWQPNGSLLALLQVPVQPEPSANPLVNDAEPDVTTEASNPDVVAEGAASLDPTETEPTEATVRDEQPEASPDVDALSSAQTSEDGAQPNIETAAPAHDTTADSHVSRSERTPENTAQKPKKPGLSIPSGPAFAEWLAAVVEQCDAPLRASLLVSLCSHRAFRQQCANCSADLRPSVERAAAVYDALFLDSPPTVAPAASHSTQAQHDGRDTLRDGLAAVCDGSMDLVRVWPQAARERLFELASDFELQNALYTHALQIFHDSPKQLGRVNLARICDALAAGDDAAAKAQIAEVKSKAGAPGLLPLLSEALDGQRFGNLVVLSYGGASSRGADPRAPKRHSGFCLESQRDVWIRSGETHESPAFEHYSQLHRRALIPSVVGLYTFGVTRSRKPYLSVLRKGISLQRRIEHSWGLSREWAVRFATDLTLLASALCRAGIRLPDLDARRFEVDEAQRLWLSDLWGGELMDPRAQDPAAVSTCRDSVVGLLSSQPGFTLPNDWREVICHSADFETLVATLRTLEKSRHWSS